MAETADLLRENALLDVWENISAAVTFVERYFGLTFIRLCK